MHDPDVALRFHLAGVLVEQHFVGVEGEVAAGGAGSDLHVPFEGNDGGVLRPAVDLKRRECDGAFAGTNRFMRRFYRLRALEIR